MAIQRVKNKNGEWIIVGGIDKWVPLTIDSQMSDTSNNPVQNKVIKEYIDDVITNSEINVKADTAMSDSSTNPVQNKVIKEYIDNAIQNVEIAVDSSLSSTSTNPVQNKVVNSAINNKQDKIVSGTHIKTINNQSIVGSGNINIQTTVDTAMSSTSTNPVQNKVVNTALGNKVDKVSGKQLSTEDFTSAFKTKLEGIEAGAQKNVQSDWNVTSEANDAFIKNKPVIDTAMSDSSTNLVQNKVIKKYIDDEITELKNEVIADEEVIALSLNNLDQKITAHKSYSETTYAVKSEVDSELNELTSELIASEEVNAFALNDLNERLIINDGIVDIKCNNVKSEIRTELADLTNEIIDDEEVIALSINNLDQKIIALDSKLTSTYTVKSEIESEFANINSIITANEEITAFALNDLNERLIILTNLVQTLVNN